MTVSVIGLGAVGLPLSLLMSINGLRVYGIDINKERVKELKNGKSGLFEFYKDKNIDEILIDEIKRGSFIPTTSYKLPLRDSKIIIVTVPLPIIKKRVNYKYLIKAIENIGDNLKKDDLVIIRSTVPIGTTRDLVLPILEKRSNLTVEKDFYLSYVPERMAEGRAFEELINMTTVISGIGNKSIEKTVEFFKRYFNGDYRIVDRVEVAEASKIIENLQRDLNIAMVNELSYFLINLGLIPNEVIETAKTHKRVKNLLNPGIGVGGHCLPYAYYYLKESKKDNVRGFLDLFKIGRKINDEMPKRVLNLIVSKLKEKGKDPKDLTITIFGIAMKDFSKDTRESPSMKFYYLAKKIFKNIKIFDDEVNIDLKDNVKDLNSAIKDSDILLFSIIQDSYKNINLEMIKKYLKKDVLIVDLKNLFNRNDLEKERIDYIKL